MSIDQFHLTLNFIICTLFLLYLLYFYIIFQIKQLVKPKTCQNRKTMGYKEWYNVMIYTNEVVINIEVVYDDQVGLPLCSVIRWEEAVPSYSLPAPSRHS